MANRLLLVDDEPLILKGLRFALEHDGYEVDEALDGEEAVKKAESGDYDLILLDVMLPKLSGMEVCTRIREHSDVPIIMLTAKGEDMDKILGLEYGADDYMTKPFNILEVKARIKAILRRAGRTKAPVEEKTAELECRGLKINPANLTVTLDGKPVNLTTKEFDILRLLMENRGRVFSREELLEKIWGIEYMGDLRAVDVHINRLRNKIEREPNKPEFILTKWKAGYYFAQ